MANLRNFIWSGLRSGTRVDIYTGRTIQIGSGTVEVAEPLRFRMTGKGEVLGIKFDGNIEIVMPDENPAGTCTVVLNGQRFEHVPYSSTGGGVPVLTLQGVAGRTVTVQDRDKSWTWIGVSGVPGWIGLWPAGMEVALDEDDLELGPVPE